MYIINSNIIQADRMLHNQVTIQSASPADATMIAKAAQDTYIETYGAVGNFKSDNIAKVKKIYDDIFVQETLPRLMQSHIVAIAKVNNEIIGFAILLLKENNVAFLDKLYFYKAHQNKGYGTSLLQFCFQQAAARGATEGKLLVSKHARKKTTGFYEKFGFKKTGAEEFLYTLDGKKTRTKNDVMTCDSFIKIFSPDPFKRNSGGRKRKAETLLDEKSPKKPRISVPAQPPVINQLIKFNFFGQTFRQVYIADIPLQSTFKATKD